MKKLIVLLFLGSFGCSTTNILSTWKKPGLQALHFSKVVVIVPLKDESRRRSAEDQIVSALAPGVGVPSYTLVPAGATRDALRDTVEMRGFDGAIVMTVRSVDKEATWVPNYDMGFYGGFGFGGWYDPGYLAVDTYVRCETSIYALPGEDLLWAAASRTANPSSLSELVAEVVSALRTELKSEKLAPVVSQRSGSSAPTASH